MINKKLKMNPMPPAVSVSKPPAAMVPPMPPTRPTLHAGTKIKPLGAQDPQILEQALLRRMNRFG